MKNLKFFYWTWGAFVALWSVPLIALAQDATPSSGDISSALKDLSKLTPDQKNMVTSTLGVPGVSNFDLASLMAGIIFGMIGLIAFGYGKKNALWKPMVIGIILMGYPYFVSGPFKLYGIGIALIALLFFWRD